MWASALLEVATFCSRGNHSMQSIYAAPTRPQGTAKETVVAWLTFSPSETMKEGSASQHRSGAIKDLAPPFGVQRKDGIMGYDERRNS